MVGTAELESATSCMSSKRSNQLSYAPEKYIYILSVYFDYGKRFNINIFIQINHLL